jgi:hypothetical protein
VAVIVADDDPAEKKPAGETPAEDGAADRAEQRAEDDTESLASALKAALGAMGGGFVSAGNVFIGSTVTGLIAGGDRRDENTRGPEARLSAGPVPRERLDRLAATFVPPPGYPALAASLARSPLVILRAPAGCGRTTATLHLLDRESAEGVASLDPDTTLVPAELPALRANHGYVVSSVSERLAAFGSFAADQLRRHLETVGARLVVIADDDVPLREADLGECLVGLGEPPRAEVVRSHLQWLLGPEMTDTEAADRVAELLLDESTRTHLAELGSAPVRDAVRLAEDLGVVALGKAVLAEVLDRRSEAAALHFFDRFDAEWDTERRALAIALAAFNGMPVQVVDRLARDLAVRVEAVEGGTEPPHRRAFGAPQRERLAEVSAELVDGTERTRHGPVATRLARFCNDRLPQRLLVHVWHEHGGVREVLCAWLADLGRSEDYAVRIRAGVAVGVLSLVEFDHLRRSVIEPWTDSGTVRERQAVIGALQMPADDPQLSVLVGRMTADWLGAHAAPSRRRAAALALGSIGSTMPDRALRMLRGAVLTDPSLGSAVASSLMQLFLDDQVRSGVLDVLLRWTASDHLPVRRAGLLGFVRIAGDARVTDERGSEPWPAVVWLADDDELRLDLVDLMDRALDDGSMARRAYAVLERWVGLAEREPAFLPLFAHFLAQLVSVSGDAHELRYYMDDWLETARASPGTRRLLSAASEGRTSG